jgi:hypothetical protein
MDGCTGPTATEANVNTATVGRKAFRVDGVTSLEMRAALTHHYEVHYRFRGSFPSMPTLRGHVRPGRAIPLSWVVADASGAPVGHPPARAG